MKRRGLGPLPRSVCSTKNQRRKMKPIALIIAVLLTSVALAQETRLLRWKHPSLNVPLVLTNTTDPRMSQMTVTNPPTTFKIYQSTDLFLWTVITSVVSVGQVRIPVDSTRYNFYVCTASNYLDGETIFSSVAVAPTRAAVTDTELSR